MNQRNQAAWQARQLAQRNATGVFSTISKKLQGFPFGSVSPILLTEQGDVIFYVSDIAQHARNLTEDSRLSITLFDTADSGDQNTQGRLTLSGHAKPADVGSYETIYFKRFPDAISYKQAHDFRFWKMPVEHVRFIAGFGEIFWLTPEEWQLTQPQWSADEAVAMIEHMNVDHADANALILQHEKGLADVVAGDVSMVGVYPEGFHLSYQDKLYFVAFEQLALSSTDVRTQLVKKTHLARRSAA